MEKSAERIRRIKEYQDSKFGIFMHWGPISGSKGDDEDWICHPREDVLPYVRQFEEKTKDFSPEKWFMLFEEIGVKYFSFVVRHPGNMYYNLYPSQVMDFCSKKDYLGEISDSCKRHHINLVVYQPLDTEGYHKWIREGMPDYDAFMDGMIGKITERLKELVSVYHPYGVWLDGWPGIKMRAIHAGKDPFVHYHFDALTQAARQIDPDLVIGNKEMFPDCIDYICSEQFLNDHFGNPISGKEIPTEVNETLPGSRVWFANPPEEEVVLTEEELAKQKRIFVKRFFSVVGRGMNYLLNVGPKQDGEIPETDLAILHALGEYVNQYGDAIYGTSYQEAEEYPWGYMVQKDSRYFLYVMDNREIVDAITCHRNYNGKGCCAIDPQDGPDQAPNWQKVGLEAPLSFRVQDKVSKVLLLNRGTELGFSQKEEWVTVETEGLEGLREDVLVLEIDLS